MKTKRRPDNIHNSVLLVTDTKPDDNLVKQNVADVFDVKLESVHVLNPVTYFYNRNRP